MSHVSGRDAPWLAQTAPELLHSFDTNVGIFVKELGTSVPVPWLPNVSCWTIDLRSAHTKLQLHVYKERLEEGASTVCDQCRIIGDYNSYHYLSSCEDRLLISFCALSRRLAKSPCV